MKTRLSKLHRNLIKLKENHLMVIPQVKKSEQKQTIFIVKLQDKFDEN